MADDKDMQIDEDALAAEASNEAAVKIADELDKKKRSVESSLKRTLDEAGLSANFQEKEESVVVEIPISVDQDREELVSKLLAEKLDQARREAEAEAERKAQEEIARRQKELEAEAMRRAEEKARQEAEEKARQEMERRRLAEEAARKAAEEEAARKAAEEAARKAAEEEAARKAAEEARIAAEKAEAEKKAAAEAARIAAEEEEKKRLAEAEAEKARKAAANAEREKRVKEMIEKSKAEKAAKPVAEAKPADADKFIPNFKRRYLNQVRDKLQKDFGFSSPMEIPRLTKIIVSFGCSEDKDNKKYMDAAVKELEQITGQHVVKTKARKSIANFKIRQGQEIGAMVTLRNDNMWYFLERLVSIALPRVRDFRGVKPDAFDGHGNYSLGITEQIIFPEIDFDKIERISGFNIAFVTTAKNDKEGYALLKELGMPFSK